MTNFNKYLERQIMTLQKIKINVTTIQNRQIRETFEACNKVFMYLTDIRRSHFIETGELLKVDDLRDALYAEKKTSFFLRKVDSQALVRVINDIPNIPQKLPPSKKKRMLNKKTTRSNVKYSTTVRKSGIVLQTTFAKIPKLGEVEFVEPLDAPVRVKCVSILFENSDFYIEYDTDDEYSDVVVLTTRKEFKLTVSKLLKSYPILNKCSDCPTDVQKHMSGIEELINEIVNSNTSITVEALNTVSENVLKNTYLREFYAILQLLAPKQNVKLNVVNF